jgi:hypothetical protein
MRPGGLKCTATNRAPSNARAVTADGVGRGSGIKSGDQTFRAGAKPLANKLD